MKIIEPSYEIIDELDGQKILKKLEQCARICYKSEDNSTQGSAERFLSAVIKRGHESVIEHFSFTVKFVVDRVIANQIERHRLASFSQSSQRYCNYTKDSFGNEITVIKPSFLSNADSPEYAIIDHLCQESEKAYSSLIKQCGLTPQQARAVLLNCMQTELYVTANLREWRHILKLRTSQAADPEMRRVMIPLLNELKEKIPVIFDDIKDGE